MHTFNRIAVLALISIVLFSCAEEKKKEADTPVVENPPIASVPQSRYTIGDSVAATVPGGAIVEQVKWEKAVSEAPATKGALPTRDMATGWHRLIVNGQSETKEVFSDTLQVELVSDIVPAEIKYSVLASYPHQTSSFTEGLEFYKGDLYEGTGQNGESKLLKIDLKTGNVLKSVPLELKYFGEGITIVNDKIYQLTWTTGTGFRYNMDFSPDKTFTIYTQGWGMTHKGETIIASDGSNKLHLYNTEMEKTGEIAVYDDQGPVIKINELEYVDGFVYANIFESTKIVKIDLATGKVVGYLNMDGIVPAGFDVANNVLNGIAYQSTEGAYYVTGKNWPLMFKIRLNGAGKVLAVNR